MTILITAFANRLLFAGCLLATSTIVVQILVWSLRPRSSTVVRISWGCVLLQGIILARFSVSVPWFPSPAEQGAMPPLVVSESEKAAEVSASIVTSGISRSPTSHQMKPGQAVGIEQAPPEIAMPVNDPGPIDRAVWNWRVAVAIGWAVGFCGLIAFTFLQYVHFVRCICDAGPAPQEREAEWLEVCRSRRVRRAIALRVTRCIGPSLCWRPFRFEVLVPEAIWLSLDAAQRQAILRHELAHYERGDLWTSLAARLIATVQWFNPAAWWALAQFEIAGEWACDDRAVTDCDTPNYVRALMQLGGARSPPVPLTDAVTCGPLFCRIQRLLTATTTRPDSSSKRFCFLGAACLLLIAGGFNFRLVTTGSSSGASLPTDGNPKRGLRLVAKPIEPSLTKDTRGTSGPVATDFYGDPLPKGARRRLGTGRLRMNDFLMQVALSPDGNLIAASAGNVDEVDVFDRKSGRLVRRLLDRTGSWQRFSALAFSPDGLHLYAAGKVGEGQRISGVARAWNVETGDETWSVDLDAQSSTPLRATTTLGSPQHSSIAVSRDGKLVATGDNSGSVGVWETSSHRKLHTFSVDDATQQRMQVEAIAFTPDGRSIIAAEDHDATIHVWDLQSEKDITRIPHANGAAVISLAITPDGNTIVSGGHRMVEASQFGKPIHYSKIQVPEIRFWDLANGRLKREFTFQEPTAGFGATALSADGKTLVCGAMYKLSVWDTASGHIVREIPVSHWWGGLGLALSRDGSIVAVPDGSRIQAWNAATGQPATADLVSHGSVVMKAIYSPDGAMVYTASEDGRVMAWDAASGRSLFDISTGPASYVNHMQISPDGRYLATSGVHQDVSAETHSVQIWYARNGRFVRDLFAPLPNKFYPVKEIAFSHDGRQLAVATGVRGWNQDDIDLWDVKTGTKVAEFRPKELNWKIIAMDFSREGKELLACSQDCELRRWNVTHATLEKELWVSEIPRGAKRLHGLAAAAFTSDLRTLITSEERSLFTWNITNGELISALLTPGPDKGRHIAVSPDEQYIATADVNYSGDPGSNLIRVFNRTDGTGVFTFDPGDTRAYCLSFAPDGKTLASGMLDGTTLLWDVSRATRPTPK